jgi:hypothetical protein
MDENIQEPLFSIKALKYSKRITMKKYLLQGKQEISKSVTMIVLPCLLRLLKRSPTPKLGDRRPKVYGN